MSKNNLLCESRPDLIQEWDIQKNNEIGISFETVSAHSNKKAYWKCSKGHSWEAVINNRCNGSGCPYCSGRKSEKGKDDFASQNQALLKEWDYQKNASVCNPDEVSPGSHTKVWWICDKGHSWQASIRDRVKGSLCPYCSGKRVLKGYNDLKTKYPQLVEEWDYDKNAVLPETIGPGSNIKAWWKCKTCGNEWEASIHNRVAGSGCPICGQSRGANRRRTANYNNSISYLYPDLLREWDFDRNVDLSPNTVNFGSSQKVWWICEKCGSSYCSPVSNRVRGSGCPVCAGKKVINGINDLATWCNHNDRKYILDEWDYEKNAIGPTEIAPFANKKIWFICKEGHSYQSSLANRITNHTGCPICERSRHTSFQEQACLYYLEKCFPGAVNSYHEEWLGKQELDIYLPNQRVGIEYDGIQWHKDTEKDVAKNVLCKNNGVQLIRIRENGLPKLPGCDNIVVLDRSSKALNEAIKALLKRLQIQNDEVDVDVERDTSKIIERFDLRNKENSIANKYPYLLDEWDYDKNGKVKPEYVNYGSPRKYWWKCSECGSSFLMAANNRTNQGQGCPNCSKEKRVKARLSSLVAKNGSLSSNYQDLLNEWDYDKNSISPDEISAGSKRKVWWKCSRCGGSWMAEIQNRTKEKGTGCPYCSGRKMLKGINTLAAKNPELLSEWDYEKNSISPDEITSGSHKKVWWLGTCGHEWEAQVKSRSNGRGCPYCSSRLLLKGFNDLATRYPEYLSEWDYVRNTDIDPSEILPGSHKEVWWKCKEGHEWEASPNHRISKGRGCPYCVHNPKALTGVNDLATVYPSLLKEWDYEKNSISPNEITSKSNRKVWWKCSKGHEWKTTIEHRANGSGCPYCAKGAQTSFPEQAVYYYVKMACPDAIHKYRELFTKKGMELDVYIPSLRVGIEYDGEAYHRSQRQIDNDREKSQICELNNIRLIRIKENPNIGIVDTDTIISAESSLEDALKELAVLIPQIGPIDLKKDEDDIRNRFLNSLSENSLLALKPDLCGEWDYEKNKTTPDMYTANSNARVWWKCSLGHEWKASIDGRSRGNKCPYCSNRLVLSGFNDLATKRPDLISEWHPTKNDLLDPSMVLPGSGKKAWWICKEGHEWEAEISSRNKGAGCPICYRNKRRRKT